MPTFRAPTDILRLLRRFPASSPTCIARPAVVSTPIVPVRAIHSTPAWLASEVPRDPMADPEIQGFYEKLRNHQGAVDAMMAVGKLMQDKGYDTTRAPTKMEMMSLSFDKDMREAGQRLMEELKNAGLKMDPQVMKAMFKKMNRE